MPPPRQPEWLVFPFYHWVLDDERTAFEKQLRGFRRYGEFIGLDSAVELLHGGGQLGGRYFCVTFDDGFDNCYRNAAPVLADLGVPAAFFISTLYVDLRADSDWETLAPFFRRSWTRYRRRFDFLDWDQCRQMARAGFTFGSHTHSHMHLVDHPADEVAGEMALSKQIIEAELDTRCRHIACPWGRPGKDYDPAMHQALAAQAGYESFLTVEEGPNLPGSDPMGIRRNAVTPSFTGALLRYHLWLGR